MSDAPERIWADTEGRWTTFDASENRRDPCVKYSRTDLIQPMIDKAVAKVMAERDAAVEALEPFCFLNQDRPTETTQEAWELRYQDRFRDWISFEDIDAARATLAKIKEEK